MSKSISTFGLIAVIIISLAVTTSGLTQTPTAPKEQSSTQSSSASSNSSPAPSSPSQTITVIGRPDRPLSDGTYVARDYRGRLVGVYRRGANGRASVKSAFGDPSDLDDPFLGGFPDAMNALDRGRAYIIANDHSLEYAIAAFDAKDYPTAFKLFKASYNKMGFPAAALMVGKMYLYGIGTPKDVNQALIWFKKAARFPPYRNRTTNRYVVDFYPDNPGTRDPIIDAVMTLGQIHLYGIHVPQDFKAAHVWYAKANGYGFAPAGDILGQIHLKGYGVTVDAKAALDYFKKAAELNYGPAQYHLGLLYYHGAEGVPVDKKLAMDGFFLAAKNGIPDALFIMGRAYDLGEGVPADPKKALIYYKDAALKGQADAQNILGTYFYEGQEVPKDLNTARKWFKAAAVQGQPDAMFNLATMYYRGEGGNENEDGYKNIVMAYVWFTLAKAADHPQAEAALKVIEPKLTDDDRSIIAVLLKSEPAKP